MSDDTKLYNARFYAKSPNTPADAVYWIRYLADEIERLTAEVDRLREALGDFLENPQFTVAVGGNPNRVDAMLAKARAALAKEATP